MTSQEPESPADVFRHMGEYRPTPLLSLPRLADRCGVAAVYVKDESRRPLGSFKSLGGMYAGLRALARAGGYATVASLLAAKASRPALPALVCASDGNHGLAVAAAAQLAGAPARIYLPRHVSPARTQRIANRGAEIVRIDGTYDDAVDAAADAAKHGQGLLIADTSPEADDPVVADVMDGYGLMAREIVQQLATERLADPTHLFVQAGCGGLAAAMARGLCVPSRPACRVVVVEPAAAACVQLGLRLGRVARFAGDLLTEAEMLSCGEVSAPALAVLRQHQAEPLVIPEPILGDAVLALAECGGPASTPSGVTGLAGLLITQSRPEVRLQLDLTPASRVLVLATEGPVPSVE